MPAVCGVARCGWFATQKVVIAEPEAAAPAAEAAATPAAATGGTAPISTATGGELGAFYDYEYGGALAGGAGPVSGAALGPTSTQAPFGGERVSGTHTQAGAQ
eukprot:XP_001703651.1 predicted protein [Chlamydomonas reinhardtii]